MNELNLGSAENFNNGSTV